MHKLSHFSDSALHAIDLSPEASPSLFQRASFLIEAAAAIAAQSCPALTIGEWCTVADAHQGTAHAYGMGVTPVLSCHWDCVLEAAAECNDKWSVDCEALANRLVNLPIAEQLAVFELTRKFWRNTRHEGETYAHYFSRLGANIRQ